ncbi:MAG: elongation factor Ts [Saprospiraceae bacterium]|jgi:elongation factor Ts|nr:elongation factor Ts [Saprospiraceae bacterium]HMT76332.1 translation elongation factor Ts [Saprospiraceae bacterium]HQU97203.1 translation elongation factor Ts [Saprospiraceae bacterium]HQW94967.1 translation elongation factor Ts [Saprospiraceae bacterium]
MSVEISASAVKQLRDTTGAGMMDCKKALTEANGDFEQAIEILRKKGQKLSLKRADRDAKEGVVIAMVDPAGKKGIIVKLSSETDFVAKNEDFIALAKKFAQIAIDNFPATKEDLLALPFENITIGDKVTEQVGVIGEKIEIANYETLEAEQVISYIHNNYMAAVIIGLNKHSDTFVSAGEDVAMQVAAMKPVAVDKDGVNADIISKEIEIGKEIARAEGKPEEMLEKIAMGKLNKFYQDNTLLNQAFVRGSGKESVRDYLSSIDKDLTVTGFKHVALG